MAFFLYLALVPVGFAAAFLLTSLVITITGTCVLIGILLYRHNAVKRKRFSYNQSQLFKDDPNAPAPDTSSLPASYSLYVLGSGGHSAEMIQTIKQSFSGGPNHHRRYIITSSDESSLSMVYDLEGNIKDAFPDGRAGTFDVCTIPRARNVHQPPITAPFTCLKSAGYAVRALTSRPQLRSLRTLGDLFKYPHVIVTNGPATGFIVGIVAHLLKMLYVVPPNCMKIVYTESWARTKTLSLTGKLFWWTGIAEVFIVQHETLMRNLAGSLLLTQIAVPVIRVPRSPGQDR